MLTEPRLIATILAGLAVLAGVIWYFARRSDPKRRTTHSGDRLDTVADWPPTATRILTTPERQAHEVLLRALPEYLVFAQVPLARFLKVPTRNSYTEWLRRLGTQCADLVVCDKATQVVAVVDVQAPADRAGQRAGKRLNRMARVLKAAQIPLHVWTEGAIPGVAAARETLLAKLARATDAIEAPAPSPAVAEPRVAAPSPRPASPFELVDRDPSSDEVIEAFEPPPSTWFDEFNSGPTPLGKPRK